MQLVVQSGAEPGRTYDITASQKIRMGRQSGNDVVVPDEQVSRRHAEIEERNGGLIVSDLGSSNGTFVNGTRIATPQSLQPGDTVQVGTTVLKVLGAASAGGASDYDEGGATRVGFQPSGQDNAYGGYGSPAAPISPQAAPTDYGQGAYGQSSPPAYGQPQSYDPAPNYQQGGSYGQQPTAYDQGGQPQGQDAYGQQPATAYDQGGQPQGQGAYGQQQAYDPAAAYNNQGQGVYGQQPPAYDPQAAYNQGQGQQQGAYAGQSAAYGQPGQPAYGGQAAYGQPAAPVVAKKGGLPLPLIIIGGVLALLIIAALVYFLVINKGGGTVGADIPEPKNATKLNISIQDFEKFRQGDKTDTSKVSFAGYASTDTPEEVATFYRTEMKNRGWTEDIAGGSSNSILFKKGDNSAGVSYQPIKTKAEADGFGAFFPTIKDQIKAGQTLVFLVSGPSSAFTTPKA